MADHISDTSVRGGKKKRPNKPLQQLFVKVCRELSTAGQLFDDMLTNFIFSGSSLLERKKKKEKEKDL